MLDHIPMSTNYRSIAEITYFQFINNTRKPIEFEEILFVMHNTSKIYQLHIHSWSTVTQVIKSQKMNDPQVIENTVNWNYMWSPVLNI